jgi:glycosyltransferase involved in cell wall biosynthesis
VRVLLYVHDWAPSVGGVETVTMALARGLATWGANHAGEEIAVTLVTRTPADGMDDAALPFRVVRRPGLVQLIRLVRGADVVHMAGPCLLATAIALLIDKPAVIEHHGFQSICPNGQLLYEPAQTPCPGYFMARRYAECFRCNSKRGRPQSLRMLMLTFPRRWLSQLVSANIVPTSWLGLLLQLNRSKTIFHGLPPLGTLPDRRVRSTMPVFVFLGRLVSTKGARVLINAAALLKAQGIEFQVRIVGDGFEREELEKLVRELGVQSCVLFLGRVPETQLKENLLDATAVVMPSLAGEVFGLVAAESMQLGKLTIASDVGALTEVIGDAGMKFSPGDAEGLARCMESVIADPLLAEKIGQRASRRIAQLFTADKMVKDHMQVYEESCRS